MIVPCRRAASIPSRARAAVSSESAPKTPPQWNQRAPSAPKMRSQSTSPGRSFDAAEFARSEQPRAGRTPKPRSVGSGRSAPRARCRRTGSSRYAGSTPPWSMRSSISRPTGLSASAVTTAVRWPKQRRSARATLYGRATLAHVEGAGRRDPAIAGVESQHHFTERDQVPAAGVLRAQVHRTSSTTSRARRSTSSKRRSASSRPSTSQLPPHARTDGKAGDYVDRDVESMPPVGTNRTSG